VSLKLRNPGWGHFPLQLGSQPAFRNKRIPQNEFSKTKHSGGEMGTNETFRLNKAILSIRSEHDGRRIAHVIPSGAIVTVVDGPLDGLRLVSALWEEWIVMMFTVDLRARSTLIGKARAPIQ
jgi:hypothetical protein